MLLAKAGVEYENKCVSSEEWAELKNSGTFPSDYLPVWQDSQGHYFKQTNAILRHLGNKYGFYPQEDQQEAFLIDWALETSQDFYNSGSLEAWYEDG